MRFLLANSLTIARLLLGLAFPLIPPAWRLPLLVAGALSDLFDGALSRYFHATSEFGKVLDPIADKVFVLGVVTTLVWDQQITVGQVVLIALRDIAVFFVGCAVVIFRGRSCLAKMMPTLLGKCATALQFVLFVLVVYTERVNVWLFTATVLVSGLAAIDYTRALIKHAAAGATTSANE